MPSLDLQRKLYSYWYQLPTFPILSYVEALKTHLSDCKTVLDVGCGAGSPTKYFEFERIVGVDLDTEYIAQAKERQTHHELHLTDVREITKIFKEKEFDCCIALDLIEHLTYDEGFRLIKDMEHLAKKKIILFTPNGYMNQHDAEHPLQNHQSGWTAKEMQEHGFEVYGMLGPKFLRTDQHVLKGNKYITGLLSEIIQTTYSYNHPETAAAILCVKHLS